MRHPLYNSGSKVVPSRFVSVLDDDDDDVMPECKLCCFCVVLHRSEHRITLSAFAISIRAYRWKIERVAFDTIAVIGRLRLHHERCFCIQRISIVHQYSPSMSITECLHVQRVYNVHAVLCKMWCRPTNNCHKRQWCERVRKDAPQRNVCETSCCYSTMWGHLRVVEARDRLWHQYRRRYVQLRFRLAVHQS